MNVHFRNLSDPQKRAKYVALVHKSIVNVFRVSDTRPVFILGLQRSGTTLLMDLLHRHRDTDVNDESSKSRAFVDYRIRSLNVVQDVIAGSHAPVAVFKVLADSHRVAEFLARFPDAKFVWAIRDYRDNALSRLRKFEQATRGMREILDGRIDKAGWFGAGISASTLAVLRELRTEELSEFDLACLVWWTRNQLFFENALETKANVRLVQYERLVKNPASYSEDLFRFLELEFNGALLKHVHSRCVGKSDCPPVRPAVAALCDELASRFASIGHRQS